MILPDFIQGFSFQSLHCSVEKFCGSLPCVKEVEIYPELVLV